MVIVIGNPNLETIAQVLSTTISTPRLESSTNLVSLIKTLKLRSKLSHRTLPNLPKGKQESAS
jgi:hypothetical protein